MPLKALDQVNIRTYRLAEMVVWYCNVLGLEKGPRPNFPFEGAWLYLGDNPVIHLVAVQRDDLTGSEADLKLEHFAFSATGLDAYEDKLKQSGIKYQRVDLPDFGIVQLNIWDPDGNHMHIDFKISKGG